MANQASDIFREWIRNGLKQAGKTQMGLAEHLGLAHPQITHMLNGKRQLKVDEVPRIAEFLGIDPPGYPHVSGKARLPGAVSEANLRSALLAFGVDREDLGRAVSAVKVFVDDLDEPRSPSLPDDQSGSSNPRRARVP